mmetsp:Transcript_9248/g.19315  ORF Transcript_9248/g.19315 Transcript_9248/m.19315 type:complete len:496 (-) Transcript_9248:457-1944(-)
MAALNRATKANYVIHDHVEAETSDREDHTFCGIMFPVKCKDVLPIDHVVINSVSVRGALGPLTVWVSKDENINGEISMCKKHWKKIYQKTHGRSFRAYKELDLSSEPIVLKPGQVKGIYIHSTLRGDEAIVYDNKDKQKTHDDSFLTILPGRAHVSETPFGSRPIWGWGHAWRDNREFVGQIKYGAIYRLWNPTEHLCFGTKFRSLAKNLFLLQRRIESPFSTLPDDCIFYILNMCRWDWMNDTAGDMKECQRELRRARRRRLEREADDVLMEGVDGSADGGHVVGGDGDELWVHNHGGNGNAGGDDGDDLVDTESDEEDGDMEQDDDDDDDDSLNYTEITMDGIPEYPRLPKDFGRCGNNIKESDHWISPSEGALGNFFPFVSAERGSSSNQSTKDIMVCYGDGDGDDADDSGRDAFQPWKEQYLRKEGADGNRRDITNGKANPSHDGIEHRSEYDPDSDWDVDDAEVDGRESEDDDVFELQQPSCHLGHGAFH